MSGATIGGVVGAAIGFWVGGPQGAQVGWMIGSAVGGYIDPEVIKAPSIGDAQAQTSADGVPIAVVYGTPPPFFGTVIGGENKARKIVVEQEGKGGPVVEEEHFLLTSGILICEGPIEGVAFIIEDGVMVYDKRPNPKIPLSETRAFESKIRLYLGTEDQLPDPALEAIHGVGETCYHRGTAYMVIVDSDRTATQGRVGQYAFGVVKTGTTVTVTDDQYIQPRLSAFTNAPVPLADPVNQYDYRGYWVDEVGGGHQSEILSSVGECQAWFAGEFGRPAPTIYIGYSANTSGNAGQYNTGNGAGASGVTFSGFTTQPDVTDIQSLVLLYQNFVPEVWEDAAPNTMCATAAVGQWIGTRNGSIMQRFPGFPVDMLVFENCGGGFVAAGFYPFCIQVIRKAMAASVDFGDPCDEEAPVLLPDSPDFQIDCDAVIDAVPTYTAAPPGYHVLLNAETTTIDGSVFYTRYAQGPVLPDTDPNFNNSAFWTPHYNAAVTAGTAPPGLVFGVDYPQLGTFAIVSSVTTTTIESGEVSLQEVQEDWADRCGVPANRINATALNDDVLPGMLVATDSTGADCSRVTQQVYFYDMPEIDGEIRCVKRGGAVVGTLTDDDFVDVAGEDDDVRIQEIELYKKLHLAYPDPDANYAITKQTFSRDSSNVNAKGEIVIGTPIPFNRDEAAQRIDIMGKIMWASAEGKMSRTLPRKFTTWVPSDCFNYNGKRWRIEKSDVADGTMAFDAVYDRQSNYQSIATGATPREPSTQTSNLRGPTRFEFINASPLRDSQDKVGIYFGVCGLLVGWGGAAVYARPVGATEYTNLGQYTNAAVMGHTTTVLPSGSPWVFDPDATVTVKVHGGAPEAASFFALLNESNAAMIGDEMCQYQSVTEVDYRTFQLTGFTRARQNTQVSEHPVHTRFVLLSRVNFFELPSAWIGQAIEFYVQSLGTPAGTGYSEVHTWAPALIQTEWAPVQFIASRDGGDNVTVSWNGRARLGTTAAPYPSTFFDGYQIRFADGATSVTKTTTSQSYAYSAAQQTIDFGSLPASLDVEIFAMNRITGASVALEGTV